VTEEDYEQMRRNYSQFNTMMQNGINDYIVKPDVNRLVDFLKNPDNDENFKKAVLNKLILDKEDFVNDPNDFQGALARARVYLSQNQGNDFDRDYEATLQDSVFAKFDALPLQEQLRIVTQSKVLERPLTKDEEDDKEKYVKGMKKKQKRF
jgi:hypothetical protein